MLVITIHRGNSKVGKVDTHFRGNKGWGTHFRGKRERGHTFQVCPVGGTNIIISRGKGGTNIRGNYK